MKRLYSIILACILSLPAFSQIDIRQKKVDTIPVFAPYDSLVNIPVNPDIMTKDFNTKDEAQAYADAQFGRIVGQKVFVLPMTEKEAARVAEWGRDEKAKLRNKYYTITGFNFLIEKSYVSGLYGVEHVIYLLKDEKGKSVKLDVLVSSYDDDLMVVGYYDKLKASHVGKEFIYSGTAHGDLLAENLNKILKHTAKDVNTGEIVNIPIGSSWECTGLQLFDDEVAVQLYYTFKSKDGQEIQARVSNRRKDVMEDIEQEYAFASCFIDATNHALTLQVLAERYGQENADLIANKKVKIGMTQEMCLLSWGAPEDVNSTITNGAKSDQWVYSISSYLYFENGILTAIQK